MSADRAASVRARLLNVAKATGTDFNLVLVRFALERLLYRLSTSAHADRFVLKGALLFTLWYDLPHRATRDADLLGFGASDTASMAAVFKDIAAMAGKDAGNDGIVFDPASVRVESIRKSAGHGGVRVTLNGQLANARCVAQVDVGFGDAVTPGPQEAVYPVLLGDLPAPHLRTYPVYTVIAEKLHAVVVLGMVNSRLKDYLDLVVIVEREALDEATLALAINATFQRRSTGLPAALPVGLSDEFASDATRMALWHALLKKNAIVHRPLMDVVGVIRAVLWPALKQARHDQ
jgi:predicted nucleotidyltransferase component of viral defense system